MSFDDGFAGVTKERTKPIDQATKNVLLRATFGIFVRLHAIRRADLTAGAGAPEQAARMQLTAAERVQMTVVRHALAAVANSSS